VNRFSHEGTLRHVEGLSNPIPRTPYIDTPMPEQTNAMPAEDMQQAYGNVGGQSAPTGGAAMGQGAAPVQVSLPLSGETTYYEKLLAFGEHETLEVSFRYRGLRK